MKMGDCTNTLTSQKNFKSPTLHALCHWLLAATRSCPPVMHACSTELPFCPWDITMQWTCSGAPFSLKQACMQSKPDCLIIGLPPECHGSVDDHEARIELECAEVKLVDHI